MSELHGAPSQTLLPPPKNYFDVMMKNTQSVCAPEDPWVTACLYRVMLEHVDPSEPLWRTPYYGQAVRVGTAEEVVEKRWKEEIRQASRTNKQIGFLAALDAFGEDAFEWKLVEHREGRRSAMQAYADAGEIRLIDEAGGPLKDMNQRLPQTLNQTKGGSGNARWTGIDAFRAKAFHRFKTEMEAFVEEFGTSYVEQSYTNPLTGYKLGKHLNFFRQGGMRNGMPDEKAINSWAESLPRWAWNVLGTKEHSQMRSDAQIAAWADKDQREKLTSAINASRRTPEYKKAASERKHQWHADLSEETKAVIDAKRITSHNTPEYLEKSSKRQREHWEKASEETKATWLSKAEETRNATGYHERTSKRSSEMWANASAEKRSSWGAAISTTVKAKTDERIAELPTKERKQKEKSIAKTRRAADKKKRDLALLRTVQPSAKWSDLADARRNGLIPSAPK